MSRLYPNKTERLSFNLTEFAQGLLRHAAEVSNLTVSDIVETLLRSVAASDPYIRKHVPGKTALTNSVKISLTAKSILDKQVNLSGMSGSDYIEHLVRDKLSG